MENGMRAGRVKAAAETVQFFRAWLSNPVRVSSVVPSGSALANLMTSEIDAASAPVIELGPGTGVFTRAILNRGIPQDRLTLVESGPEFARMLSLRFKDVRILAVDAEQLRMAPINGSEKAGAVVSGLPLLSMKPRKILSILSGAFANMRDDGAFYQFTYGFRCPVPRPILERLDLQAVRIGRAIANVPPASVYRITRRHNMASRQETAEVIRIDRP